VKFIYRRDDNIVNSVRHVFGVAGRSYAIGFAILTKLNGYERIFKVCREHGSVVVWFWAIGIGCRWSPLSA